MAGGVYKPVNSESDIDSEPGLDVVTTIDVNFQDIVESALKNQVFKTQAKYGTAVIMEVATGEIKAIANLTRITSNNEIRYIEDQNYAVIGGTDPGSTFKLASMAALLEKTNFDATVLASFEQGVLKAIQGGSLLNTLFKVRTNTLFKEKTNIENYYYLSGLLIGEELQTLATIECDYIKLCAGGKLFELYHKAISILGLASKTKIIEAAVVDTAVVYGQWNIIKNQL